MWSFDAPAPITADIDIAAGSVHLIAGDRSDTLVTINPADPTKKLDVDAAAKARVEMSRARLSVVVPKPGGIMGYVRFGDWGLVEVTIELPNLSSIEVKTGTGEIRADGEFGEMSATNGAGDIRVDQAHARRLVSGAGRLRLEKSHGDTELITAGEMEVGIIDGSAQVKNLNGRTRIGEVTGSIKVTSANGDIVVGRAHTDLHGRTANGNILVEELTKGTVSLATAAGDLDIGIAEGTSAWVDARTKYGRVRNTLEPADGPGAGERIEIKARTSFGDVDIRRSSPAENRLEEA